MPEPEEPREPDWPWGTLVVSALLLVVFLVECCLGLDDPDHGVTLVRTGAVGYAAVFEAGEWWRLLGASFVHFNLVHLLFNGWALIQLGALIEDIHGRERFAIVYVVSCLGASLATSLISTQASVGASGGIMGLIGFLIGARYVHDAPVRNYLRRTLGRQLLFWTAFILGLGFLLQLAAQFPDQLGQVPLVDNWGHLGGLFTGLALALVVRGTQPAGFALEGATVALAGLVIVALSLVAARGDESARIERAVYDADAAYGRNDAAAIGSALDALKAAPRGPRRAVGRDLGRAAVLVHAAIAAVRTDEAVRYGELAAKIDPDRGSAILAQARLAAGERTEGSEALDRYRRRASADDLKAVAIALEAQGRSALAIQFLEAALARKPDDAELLNVLAWTLVTAKDEAVRDPARALTLARRAVARSYSASILEDRRAALAMYLDTQAEAEFLLGHVELALEHAQKAVDLAMEVQMQGTPDLVDHLEKYRQAAGSQR